MMTPCCRIVYILIEITKAHETYNCTELNTQTKAAACKYRNPRKVCDQSPSPWGIELVMKVLIMRENLERGCTISRYQHIRF